MKGGQNRKSRKSKIIQGTFRADRNPQNEPLPPVVADVPKPPPWMNREGKKEWKRLAPLLVDQGILTVLDVTALELCCDAFGMYREAQLGIYRPVDPETGKRGKRTLEQYLAGRNAHTCPELTVMRQMFIQYRGLLTEFGLAPQSRNRLDIPQGGQKEPDPMEEILGEA